MTKLLKVKHRFFTGHRKIKNILVFCSLSLSLDNHMVSFGIKDNRGYYSGLVGCWRVKYKTK